MILGVVVCQLELKAFMFFVQLCCVNFPYLFLQTIILEELPTCLVSFPGAGEGEMHRAISLSLGFAWTEPG